MVERLYLSSAGADFATALFGAVSKLIIHSELQLG